MDSFLLFVSSIWLAVYSVSAYCPHGIIATGSGGDHEMYVRKHNELRDLISQGLVPNQPKGTNLKKMVYSRELEEKAQEIANTCEFNHKNVTGTQWKSVGQNLYISMSSRLDSIDADWNRAIQEWFDEHKIYHFGQASRGTGHYTQVVWADSDHVGCAYSVYRKHGWCKKLYVCNYGPAGNIQGEKPYETA